MTARPVEPSGMGGRRVIAAALLAASAVALPNGSAAPPATSHLSSATGPVKWRGTLDAPAPLGCENPNLGCDAYRLVVTAPRGAWITVALKNDGPEVLVEHDGEVVAGAGTDLNPNSSADSGLKSSAVFAQVAGGSVTYSVLVGSVTASPVSPEPYTLTAALAGHAFDRQVPCNVTTVDGIQDTGRAATRTLRARLVGEPADAQAIRAAGRTLRQIYARIGVPIDVSYDFFHFHVGPSGFPYVDVRRHYGGQPPPGVDVVDVLTDKFAGGEASCIGGIRYPERAFATSELHYTVQGAPSPRDVPAGLLAAHEIGHLLGAQHQQMNCVEAIPQEATQPAQDGWVGPCTVMGPAALQESEVFSTLERNTIRSYVNAYAGG